MSRLAAALLAAALPCAVLAAGDKASLAVQLSRMTMPQESWRKMMKDVSEQTRQYIESSATQAGAKIPPGFGARFADEFEKLFSSQELVDLNAGLLAKHYTEAELRQLLAFYKTPLGQKAVRIMPEVAADANGQMLAIMQQRMPAMMERIKAALEPAQGSAPASAPAAPPAK